MISHKFLRLTVPIALIVPLASVALVPETFYRASFGIQSGFYALVVGWTGSKIGLSSRLSDVALRLVALNAPSQVAFSKSIEGHKTVWIHTRVPKEAYPR